MQTAFECTIQCTIGIVRHETCISLKVFTTHSLPHHEDQSPSTACHEVNFSSVNSRWYFIRSFTVIGILSVSLNLKCHSVR